MVPELIWQSISGYCLELIPTTEETNMELSLIPREGEKLLSPEEREAMKKRIRKIRPEELAHFTKQDRQGIKVFFARLIALSEHVHHDMEDEEHVMENMEKIEKLHAERQHLFSKVDDKVFEFVRIVDLCAAEPWLEFEVFMQRLKAILRKKYYQVKNGGGVDAAAGNPFLMQVDNLVSEKQDDLAKLTRITEQEIEGLIFRFSLVELVANLIDARKIITGQFWDDEYYDL